MASLIKTSKLYNGKEHTFTTLGAATNVLLKSGTGEQFQIQGTLNIVDAPGGDNPADILINGNNIGSGTSLGDLSDVSLSTPIQAGSILTYTAGEWRNSSVLEVPDINTTNLLVTNNLNNNFSTLSVTTIQRLKCDNIRTGLTDCLLRSNGAERIVPAYTGTNLNLTGEFLDLNGNITDITVGSNCSFEGRTIDSTYGGTGYNNAYGFINTLSTDMNFNQQVKTDSDVQFKSINGTVVAGSDPILSTNQTFLGNFINQYIDNDIESSVLIGNNSGDVTFGLRDAAMLGNFTGRYTSGKNITLIGNNVGSITTTSSTNIIFIGNSQDCDFDTDENHHFMIRGTGDDSVVDPVISTINMNDKTIMATTLYGKTSINMSTFKYNDYNIVFTTQLKFDQALTTTSSPRFNDLGLYDLSLSYPLYMNCNETLSNSRTINLKCLDVDRNLTLGANLTVNTNYISYATQYLSFTGNSISFGTNLNFASGKFQFATPTTVVLSPNYIKLANNYLLPTTSSLWVGSTIAGEWGRLTWKNSSTLTMGNDSFINQNLGTTSTPLFQDLNLKRNDTSAATIRITNNNNNFWDIQNNNNNTFTIDYNDSYYLSVNTQGQVTRPNQSCFNTYMSASTNDVTGDGTTFKVQFNTAPTNINSNFNTGTYQYNTPVAGVYTFSASVKLSGMTSSHTLGYCEIICGETYYRFSQLNPYACQDSSGSLVLNGSTGPVNLSAGVGVYVTVYVYGGTKTVDVISDGGTYLTSFFNGTLIG